MIAVCLEITVAGVGGVGQVKMFTRGHVPTLERINSITIDDETFMIDKDHSWQAMSEGKAKPVIEVTLDEIEVRVRLEPIVLEEPGGDDGARLIDVVMSQRESLEAMGFQEDGPF